MKVLHFTLGPVQGFIAEARRVRDLWAGSFLLSWLSGQAMAALEENDGEIVFPQTEGDALFEAIVAARAGKIPDTGPYIGSLPNRFKADISEVSGDAGEICKQAVTDAWMKLADEVFKTFIESNSAPDTEEIWKQQVKNFWEINWVSGQAPVDNCDGIWLDKRKKLAQPLCWTRRR